MPDTHPELVFKVATRQLAAAATASGALTGMPIDRRDGFIHLSTAAQLPETLALHFRGQRNLMLLAIRSADLGESLRWEPSRGGQLFPHAYAAIPMSAVAWSVPLEVEDDGSCVLPEDAQ